MTYLEMERAARKLVSSWSGIPPDRVIPGRVDGPVPRQVFATVYAVEDVAPRDWNEYDEADGGRLVRYRYRSRKTRLEVQFYRLGARAAAEACGAKLGADSARVEADEAGVRLDAAGPVRALAALTEDEDWEERVGMELWARWTETAGEVLPSTGAAPEVARTEDDPRAERTREEVILPEP